MNSAGIRLSKTTVLSTATTHRTSSQRSTTKKFQTSASISTYASKLLTSQAKFYTEETFAPTDFTAAQSSGVDNGSSYLIPAIVIPAVIVVMASVTLFIFFMCKRKVSVKQKLDAQSTQSNGSVDILFQENMQEVEPVHETCESREMQRTPSQMYDNSRLSISGAVYDMHPVNSSIYVILGDCSDYGGQSQTNAEDTSNIYGSVAVA